MTMQEQVVAAARGWMGVKFHHQGRTRAAGVDCLGLLVKVAEECALERDGLPLTRFDRPDYGRNPDPQHLFEALASVLEPVVPEQMQAGDVAIFKIEGRAQHLAIIAPYAVAGEWAMIHAYAPARKVVEHRIDKEWKERMVAVFRLPSGQGTSVA